jgi:hypothetical protein
MELEAEDFLVVSTMRDSYLPIRGSLVRAFKKS